MKREASTIPKRPDGQYDKEAVEAMYMASKFLDWTRFAEDQGWDPHYTRRLFPMRTWQSKKRDIITESQSDTLASILHERKFKWSREILDTLDRYPGLIDKASMIMEAKMNDLAELYKDYLDWKKSGKSFVQKVNKRTGKEEMIRVSHPWEKVSLMDVSFLSKGLKELTEAKIKSLMLDKWAIGKLDVPKSEMEMPGEDQASAHRITVEGRGTIAFEDMQRWFDEFADKPSLGPTDVSTAVVNPETPAPTPAQYKGVQILDDQGRPVITEKERQGDGGS